MRQPPVPEASSAPGPEAGRGAPRCARQSAEVGQSGGHGKSELGAAAGRLLHGDRPAVRLDQALHDEQAEPGAAAALGPPELPEDPRDELRRDAVALVADGDRDAVGRRAWRPRAPTGSAAPPRLLPYQHRAGPRSPPGCRGSGRPCRRPARSRAARRRPPRRNRSGGSPAATRPAMIFSARCGMSTSWRWISIRPDSIRDTSSSSVISRVTRSASALTVSSITRFWSSVNRVHLASSVAVKPLTLVSGERSSWATVETRSARLRSSRARCCAPRSVTTMPLHRARLHRAGPGHPGLGPAEPRT